MKEHPKRNVGLRFANGEMIVVLNKKQNESKHGDKTSPS